MSSAVTSVQQLSQLTASPPINPNAISSFQAAQNSTTQGIDVTFEITDITGISGISLFRNYVLDQATATCIQSWNSAVADYGFSDTSTTLQEQSSAYYWILLLPTGTSGSSVVVGPQNILLNPQLAAPVPSTSVSASSSAAANGFVTVTVNVTGSASSQKIYVSGYKANPAFVAVAQGTATTIQFPLQATGETITIQAIGVSAGGTEATTGPTTTLILNGSMTIPATPQEVTVNQISTGNQITFPASKDAGPSYKIYRAQRGETFLLATLLATVTGASGTIEYLDTGGLSGDWEYFIVATNSMGNSLPSNPAFPSILYSSATIPPNVSGNTTNTATIDSVDGGGSVVVRIYGPGGVGTSYSRLTGFGSLSRPNGTISGLSYATNYVILWTGTAHIAVTTYPATLPDGYEFVGGIITTAATDVVGSGATVTLVVDGSGHVIQANPVAVGSGYLAASVSISGGGGSGAQVTPNVAVDGTIPSYTVTNGGIGYATAPDGTVIPGASTGTIGGGGSTGGSGGSRAGYFASQSPDTPTPD